MTATIDKRVVEMAFENAGFEKNVGTSLGTIDKLKQSLNFKGVGDSLAGITTAAKNVSLSSIAEGVNSISNRFSAMGIVALTTIMNITNSAINAGKRIASALTVEPIKAGLDEYETKLNSIQTILANTQSEGTNLKQVTDALNTLNEYSDKTIYNFQQMTRNVGTFTAAGVKLDVSVAAIKGIANLAAISGSNAEQASTAMYQLSQALSTGTVKLMDWNSVVNAGMGGQVFQDAIKETARIHGVAIDQIIKDQGSFRDSLQEGWFTSEILTETLQKFTGDLNADQLRTMGYTQDQIESIIKMGQTASDAATKVKTFSQLFTTLKEAAQSGWAQTWELIIGNFDQAKEFFTEANNILGGMIGKAADVRNALIQGWADLGGRDALIDGLRQALTGVLALLKPIQEAFREVFPPITSQQLATLTEGFRDLMQRLTILPEAADKLKRIFKGVFAAIDIGIMVIKAIGNAIFGLSGDIAPVVGNLTDFLARIGDMIVKFRDGLKSTDAINKAFSNIGTILSPIIQVVKDFFSSFSTGMSKFKGIKLDGLEDFMEKLKIKFEPLRQLATLTGKFLGMIGLLLSKLAPIALKLGDIVAKGVSAFIDRITTALENFEPEKIFDIINGGLLAGILLAIRKFISKGSSMFSGVSDVLDSVKGSLEAWQASIKSDILLKIAAALGIMTLSIIALSMIDSNKLTTALTAMTIMFAQLGLSLGAFQKISSSINPIQMTTMATGLLAISAAMLVMSLAVSKLGKLSSNQLIKGMLSITILIGVIKIAANTLSKSTGQMIIGASALIVFSFAIRSLISAVSKLGDLDTGALAKGLIGVGVLMAELALFLKTTDLSGMGLIKSVGILVLAGAVNLLAIAVAKLAEIPTEGIIKGLVGMGLIFTELALFTSLTAGGAGLILTAAGMVVISGAMLIFAKVMEKFGNLSWDQIAKGLTSLALSLTLIGAAAYLIPPTLIFQAAGLVVMAEALVILAKAFEKMGGMTWDEIARGVTVLASSILILSVGLTAMSGTLMGSAALFLAAAALSVLAPALKTIGAMSLAEIGTGLLALAGVFVVLGVAGAVLTPVVPTLLGLAGAMLLLGVAVAGIGAGVLLFSAGLSALAVSGAAGAAALVVVVTSIIGLIPMLVKTLGRALLALIEVLVAGAPTLLEGVVTLLNILLDGLMQVVPKVVIVVTTLITTLLTALSEKMPVLVQAGYDIILAFLDGIYNNIEDLVIAAVGIAKTFIVTLGQELPVLIDASWKFIISWIDGLTEAVEENMPKLIESVQRLGLEVIKGMIKGLISGDNILRTGIREIGQILIDEFKKRLGIASPSTVFMALALDIIKGLANGLKNNINLVISETINVGTKMVENFKQNVDHMYEIGKDFVLGLARGIGDFIGEAINAAAELAQAVLSTVSSIFDINSPSRKMFDMGGLIDEGLADGISAFARKVTASTKNLGKDALTGFNNIISKISDSVNSNMDVSPTIRPVVDLSNIEASGSQIDSLLGQKKLNLSVATIKAASVSVGSQRTAETKDAAQQAGKSPSVQFTQNNYSPKALSRIEIYRQTRNQLTQVKELVGV